MKWFNNWFRKKCEQAWVDARTDRGINLVRSSDEIRSAPQQSGMNFTLFKALGGHILESRVYNKRSDSNEGTLYMIPEDQDFAKQIAQAIMLESLKQ